MDDWPFADPPSVASITVRQIVRDGHPILLVSHDAEDGSWQFLTGGEFNVADAMLVSLGSMVERDHSLIEVADLPLGWRAWRSVPASPWHREPEQEVSAG
jgi:hypothetical protein